MTVHRRMRPQKDYYVAYKLYQERGIERDLCDLAARHDPPFRDDRAARPGRINLARCHVLDIIPVCHIVIFCGRIRRCTVMRRSSAAPPRGSHDLSLSLHWFYTHPQQSWADRNHIRYYGRSGYSPPLRSELEAESYPGWTAHARQHLRSLYLHRLIALYPQPTV